MITNPAAYQQSLLLLHLLRVGTFQRTLRLKPSSRRAIVEYRRVYRWVLPLDSRVALPLLRFLLPVSCLAALLFHVHLIWVPTNSRVGAH